LNKLKKGRVNMKIVLSAVLAIFLLGCSEDKPASAKDEIAKQAKEAMVDVKESVVEATKKTGEVAKQAVKEIAVVAKDAGKDVQEKAEIAVDKSRVAIASAIAPESTVDGKSVYKACASCHGVTAQNKALNKSQIIQGWESTKIISALNGYKDGSYGSSMKGVMKAQVSKLSDKEIKAVAKYISTL
jgi:cytochrome c553